jgi:hypothetical protein
VPSRGDVLTPTVRRSKVPKRDGENPKRFAGINRRERAGLLPVADDRRAVEPGRADEQAWQQNRGGDAGGIDAGFLGGLAECGSDGSRRRLQVDYVDCYLNEERGSIQRFGFTDVAPHSRSRRRQWCARHTRRLGSGLVKTVRAAAS